MIARRLLVINLPIFAFTRLQFAISGHDSTLGGSQGSFARFSRLFTGGSQIDNARPGWGLFASLES